MKIFTRIILYFVCTLVYNLMSILWHKFVYYEAKFSLAYLVLSISNTNGKKYS